MSMNNKIATIQSSYRRDQQKNGLTNLYKLMPQIIPTTSTESLKQNSAALDIV